MNELHHLDEFNQALANYQPSADAMKTLADIKLVALMGPSGGGRNTIIDELMKTGEYYFTVSDTTRQPRLNDGVLEQDGREYWFRNEADMLADIQAGKFLEAEVIHAQQVSGTSIRELQKALEAGKTALCDADLGGIMNMLNLKPDTIAVLVLPPSFEEWQRRFTSRTKMPVEEVRRRMNTAIAIFETGLSDDRLHLIVNDDYKLAAQHIQALKGSEKPANSPETYLLCQQLLDQTRAMLASLQ